MTTHLVTWLRTIATDTTPVEFGAWPPPEQSTIPLALDVSLPTNNQSSGTKTTTETDEDDTGLPFVTVGCSQQRNEFAWPAKSEEEAQDPTMCTRNDSFCFFEKQEEEEEEHYDYRPCLPRITENLLVLANPSSGEAMTSVHENTSTLDELSFAGYL